MIISLGIFAIAVFISVGSLLALTDAQKKALVFQSTQDNLRFALDTIAKDIRLGDFYYCGSDPDDIPEVFSKKDCPEGGSVFTFKNINGLPVVLREKNRRIERSLDGSDFQPLTSGDVSIEYLIFYVLGSPDSDNLSPRATIVLRGVSGLGRSRSELNLQTTVSQRKLVR